MLPTCSLGQLSPRSSLQKKKNVESLRGGGAEEDLKTFGERMHLIFGIQYLLLNVVE